MLGEWTEPTTYIVGMLGVMILGGLLPIQVEDRQDHIILTITSAVAVGVFGARAVVLVWVAVAVASPLLVAHGFWRMGAVMPAADRLRVASRSAGWLAVSGFSITAGAIAATAIYAGLYGRDFPVSVDSTSSLAVGGLALGVGWAITMAVRAITVHATGHTLMRWSLDPFDSVLIPYLLPLIGGLPLVTASVALYDPNDVWPSLLILWWCLPIYAASAYELHRRRAAQELRRDALAKQRLAAIGEVSARIVHQSRHQVGLMGWSIHRLRLLLGRFAETSSARTGPATDTLDADVASAEHELDALDAAKDRLSEMLTAELLHERATGDDERDDDRDDDRDDRPPSVGVGVMVDEVVAQLHQEADQHGIRLEARVACDPSTPVPGALRDAVFNLVDNAIDAAAESVRVVARCDGESDADEVTIAVSDDGVGLAGPDVERAFEPFFTTKPDGTGMGLAIAEALVAELGGELRYERLGGVTTFVIQLAAHGPTPATGRADGEARP